MKFTWTLLVLAILAAAVSAYPQESYGEQKLEDVQDGSWRTWEATKKFFRPMMDWFRNELPEKTPSDLADSAKKTATDVKEWAENNGIIQTVVGAIKPVGNWAKDTANTLKDKTFKEMFDDTRDQVSKADETVGGWLDQQ